MAVDWHKLTVVRSHPMPGHAKMYQLRYVLFFFQSTPSASAVCATPATPGRQNLKIPITDNLYTLWLCDWQALPEDRIMLFTGTDANITLTR